MQIAGSTHGKASRSTDPYLCATSFREMWLTGSASTVDLQQQVRPPFPMLGTPTLVAHFACALGCLTFNTSGALYAARSMEDLCFANMKYAKGMK